jgi:hypothetical protein
MPSFFGTPPTTQIHQTPAMRPPGYAFAQKFFNWLPALMQMQFPQYPGKLDPGLSPSMQDVIRRSQGYAGSSPHEIFAGVQGALGKFMSPTNANPWARFFGGAPDYFHVDPSQRVYGGRPASDLQHETGQQPPQQPQQGWWGG